MLVLSRRAGETIIIDGNIRVRVVSVRGSKVRLGIEAPNDVQVNRLEVHQRQAAVRQLREQDGEFSALADETQIP